MPFLVWAGQKRAVLIQFWFKTSEAGSVNVKSITRAILGILYDNMSIALPPGLKSRIGEGIGGQSGHLLGAVVAVYSHAIFQIQAACEGKILLSGR